eukprot:3963829-Amphidinium_carterae.1
MLAAGFDALLYGENLTGPVLAKSSQKGPLHRISEWWHASNHGSENQLGNASELWWHATLMAMRTSLGTPSSGGMRAMMAVRTKVGTLPSLVACEQ